MTTKSSTHSLLAYVGFRPLRRGKIHIYCSKCGRRYSNAARDEFDPNNAALALIRCPECSSGDKESSTLYRDARGREICSFCGRWRCERAGGVLDCDERIVNAIVARRLHAD